MLDAGYLIGLGSNIDPARNVPAALTRLTQDHGCLAVGTVFETAPAAMATGRQFWNAVLFVPCQLDKSSLKASLVALEEALGRDRSDPDSSRKDRPMDLDILMPISLPWPDVLALSGVDTYLQPSLASLAPLLDLALDTEDVQSGPICAPRIGSTQLTQPAWLLWQHGELRVRMDQSEHEGQHGAA